MSEGHNQNASDTVASGTTNTAGTVGEASITVESEAPSAEAEIEIPTTDKKPAEDQKIHSTGSTDVANKQQSSDQQEQTYLDKSLINWTVEDVCAWAKSETALPDRVIEKLLEHRFTGPMLTQLTERRLHGFGADDEDARHAENAIDTLLTMKAKEDPIQDAQALTKCTQLRRGWKHRRATLTEAPPPRLSSDEEAEKKPENHPSRERRWGNPIEFALALVSYAVGLGNIWRFPYLAYSNGGGAFLIVYLIFLVFLGIPIFVMELGLGQLFQVGAVQLWAMIHPRLAGLGLSSIFVASIVSIYYNVIIAWALFYLGNSFRSPLPFGNDPEAYWFDNTLDVSESVNNLGDVVWPTFGTLILAWILVFLIIFRGAQSTGKTTYFTAIFPYIVMIILLVRSTMLDNAGEGIRLFFEPKFDKLGDFNVWIAAATQIFYSLGIGWGALIAFSSFNSKKHDFIRDAYIVSIVNACTSFLAGTTVFAAVGFLAKQQGKDVSEVAASGSGLAFVIFPEILSQFPVPQLFSVLFFLMIGTLGVGSEFSMVIAVRNGIIQSPSLKWLTSLLSPFTISALLCVVFFLIGIIFVTNGGFYLLNLVDQTAAAITLVVVVLVELYAVIMIYGREKFVQQCLAMTGKPIPKIIQWAWYTTCPVLLCVIVIGVLVQYPQGNYEQVGCIEGVTATGECTEVDWLVPLAYVISFVSLVPAVGLMIKNWYKPRPQIKAAQAIEQQREDRLAQLEYGKVHRFDEPRSKIQEKLRQRGRRIQKICAARIGTDQQCNQRADGKSTSQPKEV
eukprot:gb/GECG01013403.1/.p1 GENE.gb/GECG01013403.1/~~gb/GECG01013403.1/.p1  ORF type:complete len:789 (+),score=81.43 gb/GECG01013403.1/:1-2367(+)